MAQVIFSRKTTSEINELPIVDGQLIWNIETGETYIDIGTERKATGRISANNYNETEIEEKINTVVSKYVEELNIPTKNSELENDEGYITKNDVDLSELATKEELKEKASISDMTTYIEEHKEELKGEQGIQGVAGKDGTNGKDGVSVTHSWNDTILTVTSASGTSSVDLKGDKGDRGATGADGKDGYTPIKGIDYLTDEEKKEIINEVGKTPDYIIENSNNIAEKLINVNDNGGNTTPFTMALVSDLHYDYTVEGAMENTKKAIQSISETATIDLCVFLGDYVNNWKPIEKNVAQNQISACKQAFNKLNMPTVWLKGNHDANGYNGKRLSKAEIFSRICRNQYLNNNFVTNYEDSFCGYGYMDFDNLKTRVIFADTSDVDSFGDPSEVTNETSTLISTFNISAKQLQWIADKALDFSNKDDVSAWTIIIVSHVMIYNGTDTWYNTTRTYEDKNGNTYQSNQTNLAELMKAYRDSKTYSLTLNEETCTADFTTGDKARILAFVNGHGHQERVSEYNGFKFIWCPSMSKANKESEDGNIYNKTNAGTLGETAITLMSFDKSNDKVHAFVYGAGYDREIDIHQEKKALYEVYVGNGVVDWSEATTSQGYIDSEGILTTVTPRSEQTIVFSNSELLELPAGTYKFSGEFKQDVVGASAILIFNNTTRILKNSLEVGETWTSFSYNFTINDVGKIYFGGQNDKETSGKAYLRNVKITKQ